MRFTIEGEVADSGDLDGFDSLLALLVAVQECEWVDVRKLRGQLSDVALKMDKKGRWTDG